jgi:acylphosphatase
MAKHLRIAGVVQGVGYRASFEARARALGLSGWVRNRRDGSVEAVVSGDARAIDGIVAWARRGPPAARVDEVSVTDADDASVTPGVFRTVATQ